MCNTSVIKHKKQLVTVSVLFTIFFVIVSTPWTFGMGYFADLVPAWVIYYIIGSILGYYVMWAFVRALVVLLNHERHHIEGCNNEK